MVKSVDEKSRNPFDRFLVRCLLLEPNFVHFVIFIDLKTFTSYTFRVVCILFSTFEMCIQNKFIMFSLLHCTAHDALLYSSNEQTTQIV